MQWAAQWTVASTLSSGAFLFARDGDDRIRLQSVHSRSHATRFRIPKDFVHCISPNLGGVVDMAIFITVAAQPSPEHKPKKPWASAALTSQWDVEPPYLGFGGCESADDCDAYV
ncbi:hypothetical protein F4859DRAFT_474467 [Xylaria cf. heliscus]|nr:hypothetical protein F4859DRAFT_474467 [Xylaria cf. heliscus]